MSPSKQTSVEPQQFEISRLLTLNHNRSKNKFAKKGIFFKTSDELISSKFLNFYNQGCPVKTWQIDPKKVARNSFKIFSTGDPFAIISPDIEITGENINIHAGVEHANYSPLALLYEALQLCRCAYEQGAEKITIALPEQFHPVLCPNDFNILLTKLFKASGANKIYFYDKSYQGILDETNVNATIPLTVSDQPNSNALLYQLNKNELLNYLHLPNEQANSANIDSQVMHFTRKSYLNQLWSKVNLNHSNLFDNFYNNITSSIHIPEQEQTHILLCCQANRPLAEKIAAALRLKGEKVKLSYTEGQGEKAIIPSEANIAGAVVTIIQSTRPNPDNLVETAEYQKNGASAYFFEAAMIARQAHLRGAAKINFINPYQFNARSDKAENNPKGKTGAYVQQNGLLLEAAGVNQVITAECHDNHTLSGAYTGKKIKGTAVPALISISTELATNWLNESKQATKGQLRLVTPDAGATKRTKELVLHLQNILGKKLSESRILGEKQRDSHQDDSALINNLNVGDIGINAYDQYLITDDETATGSTLCQAIINLKENGAKNISVIVVHNNMPLDWLLRQLCLARFLYLGVNNLHFSDTQEMGSLANNYDDLIQTYAQKTSLSTSAVEEQVISWFKENISKDFSNKTSNYFNQELTRFKSMFNQLENKITVHSLAAEFASRVSKKPSKSHSLENIVSLPTNLKNFYANDRGMLLFSLPQSGIKEDGLNNTILPSKLG
ncbi:ribose-phosphate pyrophosphokinase [Legionella busanensis]|uniref:Ribose-phosphate pyrophosphokinase n=1 Tax=Legionella busanensis TaxID=190655 RepID=A0A378JNJ4_9GAMM|nr:ribose-phosphate pyrophosphokinase-like domain-containing protein [Legionella busanensis]STX51570.1 ribose-phosphate pyrophosphokinase [Legionella busanensis]